MKLKIFLIIFLILPYICFSNSFFDLFKSEFITLEDVILEIDKGTNINEINESGRTFLMNYVMLKNANVEIFKYLYNQGYDNSYVNLHKDNKTLLMESVHTGQNPEIVQFLIENENNINAVNSLGWSALHYSLFSVKSKDGPVRTKEMEISIIGELISHSPDINIQNNKGGTPLMFCYLNQNPEVLFLLLEAGADPHILDNKGRNAEYMLTEFGPVDERRQMKVEILQRFMNTDLKNGFDYIDNLSSNWQNNLQNDEYFKRKIINLDELRKLDNSKLRILRNYFFAIHGYPFKSEDLNSFFSQYSWFQIKEDFDKSNITDIEKYNIDRILYVENERNIQ